MTAPLQTLVIAGDEPLVVASLLSATAKLGYRCVAQTSSGVEALKLVQRHKPNLLLMNVRLPDLDGFEALKQITPLNTTAVVFWVGDVAPEITSQALDSGASGFLVQPFDIRQVRAVLELGWHHFQVAYSLRAETLVLKDNLETRKLVDRAKGILMEARGISEPEAYRLLQRMSQDKRMSIKDVCKAVEHIQMVVGTKTKKHAA
jgi:AmiR/NasT family two-component response regulator